MATIEVQQVSPYYAGYDPLYMVLGDGGGTTKKKQSTALSLLKSVGTAAKDLAKDAGHGAAESVREALKGKFKTPDANKPPMAPQDAPTASGSFLDKFPGGKWGLAGTGVAVLLVVGVLAKKKG